MKYLVTITMLGLYAFLANAQSIQTNDNIQAVSKEVVATGGQKIGNGDLQMYFTIGEVAVGTQTGEGLSLNQGFQYPQIIVSEIQGNKTDISQNTLNLDLNVYPNPTTELLNVNLAPQDKSIVMQVYTLNGEQIHTQEIAPQSQSAKINFSSLPSATYLLYLSDEKGQSIGQYKIYKTN